MLSDDNICHYNLQLAWGNFKVKYFCVPNSKILNEFQVFYRLYQAEP